MALPYALAHDKCGARVRSDGRNDLGMIVVSVQWRRAKDCPASQHANHRATRATGNATISTVDYADHSPPRPRPHPCPRSGTGCKVDDDVVSG